MDESNKIMFLLDIFDSFGWPRDWPQVYAFLEKKLGSSWHNCNQVGTYNFTAAVSQAKLRPNTAEIDITVDLLKKCLRTNPSERLTWPEILEHPFWTLKFAGHVPSIPSAPTALSDIDFEDIQNFLDKSCKLEASAATLVLPKDFSIRALLFAMDHLLHYGKKAGFSRDTALKAYYIWRHAIQNGLKHNIYAISAALFLAGSYNEDFRIKNFNWITWSALWDESKCLPKFSEAVLECLKACKGHWPKQSFEALCQSIHDIVGPSIEPWAFPFLAACDDLEDLEDFAVELQILVLNKQIATVPEAH
jgi:serine/threonine protein kinase